MAQRPRSPQDKKRLSRERDGRNDYGENDKASRKAIPAFKRRTVRAERREVAGLVGRMEDRVGTDAQEFALGIDVPLAEATFRGARPRKRKAPDAPLGLCLDAGAARAAGSSDDDHRLRNRREAVRKSMTAIPHGIASLANRKKPAGSPQ